MFQRLLWSSVCIFSLVFQMSAFAAKVKEKSPPPVENSRAAELVKIGLQAELAGNSESRQLHLQAALDIEPDYAPANWHLGKVHVGEEWLPVEKASAAISKTPQYSLYRAQRDDLDGSVKKELLLARWCEQEGLLDRSQFHYARLLANAQVDEKTVKEAIKKLDLVVFGGRLRFRDEVQEIVREAARNETAWSKWAKKFAEWQRVIDGGREAKQKHAREQLMAIDDLHVIPLIESYLPTASQSWSRELLLLLAKFPQPAATETLTRFAVLSPHETAREQAISELKKRKLHDFVPMLMAGLSPSLRSQFLVSVDRNDNVTYQHLLEEESATERKVVGQAVQTAVIPVTVTQFTRGPNRDPLFTTVSPWDNVDVSAVVQQEAQNAVTQAQLVEQRVALQNALTAVHNERFFMVLEKTTKQAIAREATKWWQWWKEYNEAQFSKATSVQIEHSYQVVNPAKYEEYNQALPAPQVARPSRPRRRLTVWVDTSRRGGACFVAGTKVRSEAGLQSIEEIRPGDRVLSQDLASGELSYKLVMDVSRTAISNLRQLTIGNEGIVATPGHPIWVNGFGWKMAKELQVGEQVHTIHGSREVTANSGSLKQDTVYNLIVADFNTYFVGEIGALVHDLPYREPTSAKVPGLIAVGR